VLRDARAPFGSGGVCPLQAVINSFWPPNATITLTKTIELPAEYRNVRVLVSVDSDVQVLINGTDISAAQASPGSGMVEHDGCPLINEFLFRAPDASVVTGPNLLKVRARNRGGESYLDLQVFADAPPTTPPLPKEPDLIVSVGVCIPGSGLDLGYRVHNGGSEAAGSSTTQVVWHLNGGQIGDDVRETPPLGVGEATTDSFNIPTECLGFEQARCTFLLQVDVFDLIRERDEGNNIETGECF
jgi:hypothetical protein